ncbi:hypothetical protein ACP275_09G072400 [Erythranthe tilingii]
MIHRIIRMHLWWVISFIRHLKQFTSSHAYLSITIHHPCRNLKNYSARKKKLLLENNPRPVVFRSTLVRYNPNRVAREFVFFQVSTNE